jgi:hypothetical protein
MHRRASVLFLGLFAVSAAFQGAAACNGSPATTPGEDSGFPDFPDSSNQTEDTGIVTQAGCTGLPPVMTVTGPGGTQIDPDWSCYDAGAAFLFRPFDEDGGDDAQADGEAVDAGEGDVAVEAGSDSSPPVDAAPPPADASVPDGAAQGTDASNYALHITDFVTSLPPVGATVNLIWGPSSLADASATGTVDDAGIVFLPPPPAGQQLLSYYVSGDGQAPLFWLSTVIVPPPGQTAGNSISISSRSELLLGILASQQPDPSKAVIVTGAEDCQYRDVKGAQFQVIDTTTGQPVATGTNPGDPRTFYLDGALPNSACTFTSNSGRPVWSMINAPVDVSGRYELQFLGRMKGQPAPVLISHTAIESYAGTATVHRAFRLNTSPPN